MEPAPALRITTKPSAAMIHPRLATTFVASAECRAMRDHPFVRFGSPSSEELFEMLGVLERPDQRESQLLVLDQLLGDALHVLARDGVQPFENLVDVRRALLEHLASQAEQ